MAYRVEILNDNNHMRDFLDIPCQIYKDDPYWVTPLKSEICRTLNDRNNPYFNNASLRKFVCYKSGTPVARAVAVINHEHWKKFGTKTAFFGFFESIKDPESVSKLFNTICRYCLDEGAELLEGPFNPNHYSELGILTENFHDAPMFFEPYNPDYYHDLLANNGFKVSKKLHTRINRDAGNFLRDRYGVTDFPVKSNDYTVRFIRIWNLKADLERIREINNDAFADNWNFLPLSNAEYMFSLKYLFFVTTPKLIVLIEKGNEPVGVVQFMLNINHILQPMHGRISFPDYFRFLWYRKSVPEIVLYAAGIKKAYQNTQVAWLIVKAICSISQRYRIISTTWMSDDNTQATKSSEHLGLKPYKWFSIYRKPLK